MTATVPDGTPQMAVGWEPQDAAVPAAPTLSVRLLDGVIEQVVAQLTGVAPERGGVLMGVRDRRPLVTLLVSDAHGEYWPASWRISAEAGMAVGRLEQDSTGLLLGTVHSHPAAVPDPSGQDEMATARLLDANPHMERAVVLVVTQGTARPFDLPLHGADGHEWRLAAHIMSRPIAAEYRAAPGHAAHRQTPSLGDYLWDRARIEIVPLAADLAGSGVHLNCGTSTTDFLTGAPADGSRNRSHWKRRRPPAPTPLPMITAWGSSVRLAVQVTASENDDETTSGVLLIPADYPERGPVAVPAAALGAQHGGPGQGEAAFGPWDPTRSPGPQLSRLVRRLRGRRIEGADDRTWPLVGDLADKTVLLVGAGSVGSNIAEHLVRSGVGTVRVLDPDTVAASNLARSSYRAHDLDRPKVDALAELLTEIDPAVIVGGVAAAIGGLAPSRLDELIDGVDVAVLATDDMYEQGLIAHRLFAAGVPHISCALYAKAAAGEVTIVLPELGTPCWNCHVGGHRAGGTRGVTNYGVSSRLVGEAGLGPSISLVSSYAALTALAVLAGPTSPVGEGLLERVVTGRTLGVVTTTPSWEWFPQVLGDAAGGAPQSVWLYVQRDPDCAVCGDTPVSPASDAAIEEIDSIFRQLQGSEHGSASATGSPTQAGESATGPTAGDADEGCDADDTTNSDDVGHADVAS